MSETQLFRPRSDVCADGECGEPARATASIHPQSRLASATRLNAERDAGSAE
jgi:hypothetical protein